MYMNAILRHASSARGQSLYKNISSFWRMSFLFLILVSNITDLEVFFLQIQVNVEHFSNLYLFPVIHFLTVCHLDSLITQVAS